MKRITTILAIAAFGFGSAFGEELREFTTQEVTLENWSDNPPIPSGGGGG